MAGPSPDNQVVIVGGGLAGLAASLSLSKAGFDVVLLEAANYLGRLSALTFSVLWICSILLIPVILWEVIPERVWN